MYNTTNKEERIYNQSIGDMGIYLVINKILPNELSLYHYDIIINIEVVDMNKEDEVENANRLLRHTYNKLKNHIKFKGKVSFKDNKIMLLKG